MRALKKLALLVLPLVVTACQTPTPIGGIDTSCQAFEPITYSRKDTAETMKQVREHNAAWDALCKDK